MGKAKAKLEIVPINVLAEDGKYLAHRTQHRKRHTLRIAPSSDDKLVIGDCFFLQRFCGDYLADWHALVQ